MNVDRLSLTVPAEMGAALRALAAERGEPVSALVTEAIAQRLRLEALDKALAEADQRFGEVPGYLVAQAEAEIMQATRSKRQRMPGRRKK